MRGILADFAGWRSERNRARAERALTRADWWLDVRTFFAGLNTWANLRAARLRRKAVRP